MVRKGLLLMALLGACLVTAWAQDIKPERAIKFRQGILQAQGWNAAFMNAMIKGDRPYDKAEFLQRAVYLEQLSHMAWEGFIPGSDQGAPTKAKAEIWKEPAKFTRYQTALQTATANLVVAARTGELATIKPAFNDVAKACGNCHDDFRAK